MKFEDFVFTTKTVHPTGLYDRTTGRFTSRKTFASYLRYRRDKKDVIEDDLGIDIESLTRNISPPRNRPNDIIKARFPTWNDNTPEQLRDLVSDYFDEGQWKRQHTKNMLVDWTTAQLIFDNEYEVIE